MGRSGCSAYDGGNIKSATASAFDFELSIDAAVGDFTLAAEPSTN